MSHWRKRPDPDPIRGFIAWVCTLVLVLFLLSAVLIYRANAHDHARPELNGWFMSLQNKVNMPCCDASEATRLDDVDWEAKDGHYRVRLEGEWVDVPDRAVVDGPNRAGPTMVWPVYYRAGYGKIDKIEIRCFMPGTMG